MLASFTLGFTLTTLIIDKGDIFVKKMAFSAVLIVIAVILYIIGSLKKK